jgi:hypothetical protein
MKRSEQKTEDANSIMDRMRSVRSSGRSHAYELQGEAHRLVDWKEYVLTKPLVSLAVTSVLGFAIARSTMRAITKPQATFPPISGDTINNSAARASFASGALALGTAIASSAIKSYFANLIQRSISERDSSDRLHKFNSRINDID